MRNSACGRSMQAIKGVARGESRLWLKSEAEDSKETGTKSVGGAGGGKSQWVRPSD